MCWRQMLHRHTEKARQVPRPSCPSLTAFHQPNFNKAVAPAHSHLMVWSLPACLQPRASQLVCINILMHSLVTRSPGTDSSLIKHSSQSESESSTAILAELQLGNSDTTDCLEIPFPTRGQRAAVADGITLATPAATHVIILPSFAATIFLRSVLVC